MTRSRSAPSLLSVAAALGLAIAVPTVTLAQGRVASTSDLKAAFVLNFVRFTDWPADAIQGNKPIVVCLVDDTGVSSALQQLARGRTAGSREVQVRWVAADADLQPCHVVYLSGIDPKRSDELVTTLQDRPVLTISDDVHFAERGGIANFFVEKDHMGFAVNVTALQRARLQLSAKLLTLARIVRK